MSAVSAMFEHSQRFYTALEKESVPVSNGDDGERYFSGHTTKIFQALGLPSPYYGRLMDYLTAMGCITQVKRGSRSSLSEIVLHRQPTQEAFLGIDIEALEDKKDVRKTQEQIRDHRIRDLMGQVADLTRRLSSVEKNLEERA